MLFARVPKAQPNDSDVNSVTRPSLAPVRTSVRPTAMFGFGSVSKTDTPLSTYRCVADTHHKSTAKSNKKAAMKTAENKTLNHARKKLFFAPFFIPKSEGSNTSALRRQFECCIQLSVFRLCFPLFWPLFSARDLPTGQNLFFAQKLVEWNETEQSGIHMEQILAQLLFSQRPHCASSVIIP